jgi:hypothetical protein
MLREALAVYTAGIASTDNVERSVRELEFQLLNEWKEAPKLLLSTLSVPRYSLFYKADYTKNLGLPPSHIFNKVRRLCYPF